MAFVVLIKGTLLLKLTRGADMNVRIIQKGEVVMEIFNVDISEIPVEKSTVLVKGILKHCCSVIKSYEVYQHTPQVWFVADVY